MSDSIFDYKSLPPKRTRKGILIMRPIKRVWIVEVDLSSNGKWTPIAARHKKSMAEGIKKYEQGHGLASRVRCAVLLPLKKGGKK